MPEQKLNLFQIAAVLATELRSGPAQVMGAEVFDSNLLCRLLDDRPDRPVAQLVANQLPALGKRPQQAAVLDLGRCHPGVDSLLDPEWNCHGADSAALATKIGQDPPALPHLDHVHRTSSLRKNLKIVKVKDFAPKMNVWLLHSKHLGRLAPAVQCLRDSVQKSLKARNVEKK
jgi:hypothetical protein